MGGAHDLVGAEGAVVEQVQHIVTALVAELAGHGVHLLVLAEGTDTGSQDDQVAAVRHDHAGAVDALVAHPGGLELLGVQIGDHLLGPALHMDDVQLLSQLAGLLEGHPAIADVQAVEGGLVVHAGGDSLEEHHGQLAVDEVLLSVVVQHAGGAIPHTQGLLHAADGGEHVALVDHAAAAQAHEQVLGVVGHAHHLVGDHLAHGQDQVKAAVHQQVVDLHLNVGDIQALADLAHHLGGHLAQHGGVALPVVHQHILVRHHIAEELLLLLGAERHVGAQGGHHLHLGAHSLQAGIEDLGDLTGEGVAAGIIGGDDQDLLDAGILRQQLLAHGGDFLQGDAGPVGIIQLFHEARLLFIISGIHGGAFRRRTHVAACPGV